MTMPHVCTTCGETCTGAPAEVIDPGTNENDVAIAEAEAEAAVAIAEVDAAARVEIEEGYQEARIAEAEAAEAEAEAQADVMVAAIEAEAEIVQTEIEAEAEIVEAELETAEPHEEPDGDEGVGELAADEPVQGVEVPPQLREDPGAADAAARPRTTTAFRRHRARSR